MSTRLFGQSVRRVEDPGILRGKAHFLDDVRVPGDEQVLHVAVVRSTVAHGHLRLGDLDAVRKAPGVVDVVTADDLGERNGPFTHPTWFPPADALREAIEVELRPEVLRVLATDRVRYAGEPVAAVVATDPYLAADAAELVELDYDPLPTVTTVDEALAPDAPRINPDWEDNLSAHFRVRKGDVDAAFARAHTVVRGTFTMARQTGAPMEPRGTLAVAEDEPDGMHLTVWSSTQAPLWLRKALATWTGLELDHIRVIAPHVGGGFGIKSMVYPEELLTALLALRLGRPVKWVETRTEHFLAAVHSRDQRHEVELAVDADGRILGLRDHYVVDTGASNVEGLVVPYNTTGHLQGAYRVPALEVDCRCVLTNKSPLSAYRGAGRPEAVFAMERILDRAAEALGMDPVELRRRNLIPLDEMPYDAGIPYRDGTHLILDAGDVPASLEKAVEALDYDGWRRRQAEARAEGRYIGIGVGTYVEGTGIGPREPARVRIEPDGGVVVAINLPNQGQGHATTLAQIVADELTVKLDKVRIVQGDTAVIDEGGGTIASRTAVVAGNAVGDAARNLRDELLRAGAELLEAAPEDLEVAMGRVMVRGAPRQSLSLAEVATLMGDGDGMAAEGSFSPERVTFASGTHMAVVEVDPWLGEVKVLRYLVVHDCGRVINPVIVDAQVAGGVAQGLGGALLEELVYDADGQLVTGTFMDYLLPRSTGTPGIDVLHLETPSKRNPLGIKGVGEAGTIGPPAVIAGAIEDALRQFGARVDRCPMPPSYVAGLVPDPAAATPV